MKNSINAFDVEDLKTLKHLEEKMKSTLEKVENILGSISE